MNKFKESEYYMSNEHISNFEKGRVVGRENILKLKKERIKDYNINPKLCTNCEKPLEYEKKNNKFCCKSCAAIYNNKNRSTEFITEEFKNKQRSNAIKVFSDKQKSKNETSYYEIEAYCPECGKLLTNKQKKYKYVYCSQSCYRLNITDETKKKLSDAINERIKIGLHKGWKSRNIESFPETFFKKVLDNNGIKYEFNYPIPKRSLGLDCGCSYFLDFYIIDKNVDLEIDGRQHKLEERIESDIVRNEALIKNGFIVYRIEWKNINTKKGKEYIKNEIEKFLEFIK